jgi:alkylated DNA repair dioxygenase AlkB
VGRASQANAGGTRTRVVIDLSNATALADGIALYRTALPKASALFEALRGELNVRQEYLRFFGRDVAMPRLTGWYGDPGATYTYSRLRNEPVAWTPSLRRLRDALRESLCVDLNSCLVNWYRDGNDSMGWHADREPELRDAIVSVTLGSERTFQLREGRRGAPISVVLPHGSILVMSVASQQRFAHRVPKESSEGERLNLTFRKVVSV